MRKIKSRGAQQLLQGHMESKVEPGVTASFLGYCG